MATYDELRVQVGRTVIEVIELDLDFCSLIYGIAPCTASIGVTGDFKCYNTRNTCQDPENYSPAAKTYRFSSKGQDVLSVPFGAANPQDFVARPTLQSVNVSPTQIEYSSMGKRATITAVFQDEPDNDLTTDKYVNERLYDPLEQGTFWGKLLARNPFYIGRAMRYKVGYLDDDGTFKYQDREYIIDKIAGPDANGKVTVTGKDVLKLVDDKRAQAPVANTGQLLSDITINATSAELIPAGVGDLEYAADGSIRIGDEIIAFTRVADILTLTDRGTDSTTAEAHSATDPVQQCLRFTNERIDDITFALLSPFINPSKLDTVGWAEEVDEWLIANLYTTIISIPTGINELMTELIVQGLFYIWYDEIDKLVKIKAIAPTRETLRNLTDEDNIIKDTLKITDREKSRLSQVWVIYDIINPTGDLDKISNYKKALVEIDSEAESADEYGDQRVERIFSRWMTANDAGIAVALAARRLAKFRNTPKHIEFKIDAQDQDLWTGDDANLITKSLQNVDGSNSPSPIEILSARPDKAGSTYTFTCAQTQFVGRYAYIKPNPPIASITTEGGDTITTEDGDSITTETGIAFDYSSATEDDKANYGYICYDTGLFLDGTKAYKII